MQERHKQEAEGKEKAPKTRAIRPDDKEFKVWVERQPKPDPGDPEKGNRVPPEPSRDLKEAREPGTSDPHRV